MTQDTRNKIIFWAITGLELLMALKTGLDTYHVAHTMRPVFEALLYTLIIDGSFITALLYLRLSGSSMSSTWQKPVVASLGGVALGIMVVFSTRLETPDPILEIGTRLLIVTMYVAELWHNFGIQFVRTLIQNVRDRVRTVRNSIELHGSPAKIKERAVRRVMRKSVRKAVRTSSSELDDIVLVQIEAEIRQLPADTLKIPQVVQTRPNITAGRTVKSVQSSTANTLEVHLHSLHDAVSSGSVPAQFSIGDIQKCLSVGRTTAYQVVRQGIDAGSLDKVGKGTYELK